MQAALLLFSSGDFSRKALHARLLCMTVFIYASLTLLPALAQNVDTTPSVNSTNASLSNVSLLLPTYAMVNDYNMMTSEGNLTSAADASRFGNASYEGNNFTTDSTSIPSTPVLVNDLLHGSNIQPLLSAAIPPIIPPPAGLPSQPSPSVFQNIMSPPNDANQSAVAAASQGVVASSLLLASGICFTVAGGIGVGYAGLSHQLGLVSQAGSTAGLLLQYQGAGMNLVQTVRSAATGRRLEAAAATGASSTLTSGPGLLSSLINSITSKDANGLPEELLSKAKSIRASLTASGGLVSQLSSLRTQLSSARKSMSLISKAMGHKPILLG
ncbi:hypothetical protein CEUSTIGMA_g6483.t1 [Chlamydomonas eustigma]|uniref:Uncharacterized protein n=1 Tax=Chlamydomonas eustigma TaxID=1157962 RepID=A0A250X7I6_9CHLO|nr:hypothetical protein CEUSTIGMA_g6483.t1 [Chlamydomonas eustigma]|eukprot:GAX79043.1 hypothetical protein CEUSTIGMA_g6483.t1 [Chlamydomonas eustigma]